MKKGSGKYDDKIDLSEWRTLIKPHSWVGDTRIPLDDKLRLIGVAGTMLAESE